MKVECCEVIHHIHGQADGLCPRRHRRPGIACAGAKNGDHPAETGRHGIAFGKLDPRRLVSAKTCQVMVAVGRVPANLRARGGQQAQFRARQIAGADEQHHAALQIEEHGQESHATLASPTPGVDWNYFLYMSHSMPAKRKLFLLYCGATIEFSPPNAKGR